MPTEVDPTSVTPLPTHSRDTPPHLDIISNFELADLKVSETLEEVKGPLDDLPEEVRITNFESDEIPGLFSPRHCVELEAKIRIMKAVVVAARRVRRLRRLFGVVWSFP